MAGSARGIREIADHGARSGESYTAARAIAHSGVQAVSESLGVAAAVAEPQRCGSGCRAHLRIVASLPLGEKRKRNAGGRGAGAEEISPEQVVGRSADVYGKFLLGRLGPHQGGELLPARAGWISEWQKCLQRRMARGVDGVSKQTAGCRRTLDRLSAEVSGLFQFCRCRLLAGPQRGTQWQPRSRARLLRQSHRALSANVFCARRCCAPGKNARWRRRRSRISCQNSAASRLASL